MTEQSSEIFICRNCGDKMIHFDPPLQVDPGPVCGATLGTRVHDTMTSYTCLEEPGHEGKHLDICDEEVTW